jgi:very-short-patch-repair endonuclease
MICQYCSKECKSATSHRNHERCCPSNETRNYKNGMTGKTSWNRGLTKEDPRVKKNAEGVSKTLKGRPGRPWTDEQRLAKSEWRKQYHRDNPEAHPNRKLANNKTKMSYPEQIAYNWLLRNNIPFEHQKRIGKYYPDFVIGSTIIEIDGERWHSAERDQIRDCFLSENGYTITRIKAKEPIEDRLSQIFSV